MRHFIIASGLAALLAFDAHGQNTNLAFTPGKLAVFRGGDGVYTIVTDRQHPAFIDEYDPAITNQTNTLMTVALPTNGANAMWFNAHAGSEGQGLTRSADRRYLAVTGYNGDLNSIPGTPSSATNAEGQGYPRGFGIVDAFTNFNVLYSSADWFGILPGITQNNPRGIATDGSNNFWGCGTIAGTQTGGGFQETGTLFWNNDSTPYTVQNYVDSAYSMKIINNVLYMVAQTGTGGAQNNGIYTFVDVNNNPVSLPDAGNNVLTCFTNLFLNFGNTYSSILTFDMSPDGSTVYAADTVYGIVKFVNSGGTWTSPYLFNSNNIGSGNQPKGGTGCFGIAVDFSGTNPVIYATTMDLGDGANTCSNRLISIVDTGIAPDPNADLALTLAVADGTNEVFRGVDFTPDLAPEIVSQPANEDVITNTTVSFNVGALSYYPMTYLWQDNGTNLMTNSTTSGVTNATLVISNVVVSNAGNYTVIVSNQYGAVTSEVANLYVSLVPVPPTITNTVRYVTNFIANNQAFSVNPSGTPPFTYQWYFVNTNSTIFQLVDDGITYHGSTNSTLNITNLQLTNSGSFYIVISNQGGGISNLVDILTVEYLNPSIPTNGEPGSVTMLQGQTTSLSVTSVAGTPPLSYQWYQAGVIATPLANANEFSGVTTNTLTITGATTNDDGGYFCIVTNMGGSVTSLVATVTVIIPPALSYVPYSNQVYFQNFDSLPNPGSASVNTVGGGGPTTISGVTYDVADPFDFAYPLYANIAYPSGGLNLAATMSGWYGECDLDTAASGAQLGASDGDQTTGGIISFGTLSPDPQYTNRALGLISTSTSGGVHFGLKLINETTSNLNYISLQFTGENWKLGTKPKKMTFGYNIDSTGNSSTLSSSEIAAAAATTNSLASLSFGFPTNKVGPTNGNLAINQKNLAVTNLALASPWTPGSALWLVWSIADDTGSGQGYGIKNLSFYASTITNLNSAEDFPLNAIGYSTNSGLSLGFNCAPGLSSQFSVRTTTDLTQPLSQWVDLGNPTEVSFGTYQFIDAGATNNTQRFYSVTSP